MSLEDFELLEQLGTGAFSVVHKVLRRTDQQIYALKKVSMQGLKEKDKHNSVNEVRILASLDHPNIIAYREAFIDSTSNSLWCPARSIVMEFADAGDLLQRIAAHKKQSTYFQESDLWRIFLELTKGLKALHDLQILHRDLKVPARQSANVFLFRDGSVKLGDMNVSKVAKQGLVYTQTGTPYYASPEVWKDQPYDLKSDIWSLGCVLYEAAALHPPFLANDMSSLYRKVLSGQFPPLPVIYSNDLTTLIRAMLQVSPTLRPTCDRLLGLPVVLRNARPEPGDFGTRSQSLLQTIAVPKNLNSLSGRLPAATYNKKLRGISLPLSSKHSHFHPQAGPSLSSQDSPMNARRKEAPMAQEASVVLPRLPPIFSPRKHLSPYASPARAQNPSLAQQLDLIRSKYERVRPGLFLRPAPTVTRSSVLPPWWG